MKRQIQRQIVLADNLEALAKIPRGSVTLAYLDPPFNSGRSYDAYIGLDRLTNDSPAFDDRWTWNDSTDLLVKQMKEVMPNNFSEYFYSLSKLLGPTNLSAYLVWLIPRLYLINQLLCEEGSLYLHCDSSSSHYLKLVLDKIFGEMNFKNEIIWKRTHAHSSSRRYGPIHDVILYYARGPKYIWNPVYTNYDSSYIEKYFIHRDNRGKYQAITCTAPGDRTGTRAHYEWHGLLPPPGRHWAWTIDQMEKFEKEDRLVYSTNSVPRLKRYVDDSPGVPIQDIWNDISRLDAHSNERIGYETQKPVALLERIIHASSRPGDLVLDPFCGSGTTMVAAERLGRQWIGIDASILACSLSLGRTRAEVGMAPIQLKGFPKNSNEATKLLHDMPLGFGAWGTGLLATLPDRGLVSDSLIVGFGQLKNGKKSTKILSLVPISSGAIIAATDILRNRSQTAVLLEVPEIQPSIKSWLREEYSNHSISVPLQSLTSSQSTEHGLAKEILEILSNKAVA